MGDHPPQSQRAERRRISWFHGFLPVLFLGLLPLRGADLDETRLLQLQGNYAGAIAAARIELEETSRTDDWCLILAESLRSVGEWHQARQALTNALEAGSRSLRVRWLHHLVALDVGDTNAAAQQLVELFEFAQARRAYRSPAERIALGQAALALGAEPKQVLDRVFEPVRQEEPGLRDGHLAAGELALAKRDYALAARRFQEGLKHLPKDPDLHYGLARAYAPDQTGLMLASLAATLELNSNHVGALLLLADHHLDAEDFDEAASLLRRTRAVNPNHPEAWAYQAVLAHLRRQPAEEQTARAMAMTPRTNNPTVPHLIGRKLSRNYRFAEGAALQREALAFDPSFLPAKAQLAEDLLRLGQETEGWALAAEVERADPYDVAAYNLGALRRTLEGFTTLSNRTAIVRMQPREAAIYGPRVLELLDQAGQRLGERYGLSLDHPVLLEIFADGRDFAVRTFGMPENHGFLGVCFGPVITANSPATRPGRPFNWESMLWHEFAHVVTLHLTRNRMPRWLSEGISVFEERQANPAWGEQLTPEYRAMLLAEDLTPLSKLSAAFLTPPSPLHLQFAYYQSSLVVQFLAERHGFEKLQAILRDLGDNLPLEEALERHTAPLAQLDADFHRYARDVALRLAPTLDWTPPPKKVSLEELESWAQSRPTNYYALLHNAEAALEEQRWADARNLLNQVLAACPEPRGANNPYALLARAARGLNDPQAERQALNQLVALNPDHAEACRRLIELARTNQDWEATARYARLHLAIDPLVPLPHQALADAAEHLRQPHTAIASYRALLQLDPPNPAEIHFRLARQLHQIGDPTAKRHLLQALEDAPRHRPALQLLLEVASATPDPQVSEPATVPPTAAHAP